MAFDYSKMIMSSLYFNPQPKKILMLGLGIGTLPRAFSELLPNSQIDIVDINNALYEINKKYFYFDIDLYTNIQFHLDDAFDFVKKAIENNTKYDLIISDLFDENYIPEKFLTNEYMQNIKQIMTEDGLFTINSFINSKTRTAEDNLIKNNFGKNFVSLSGSNKITITTQDNYAYPMKSQNQIADNIDKFTKKFKKLGIDENWLIHKIKYQH
jgi:spermidine synthase